MDRAKAFENICKTADDISARECAGVSGAEQGVRALARFKREYADVVDHPAYAEKAMAIDREQLSKGDIRPTWERYQEIGEQLRAAINGGASPDAGLTRSAQIEEMRQAREIGRGQNETAEQAQKRRMQALEMDRRQWQKDNDGRAPAANIQTRRHKA